MTGRIVWDCFMFNGESEALQTRLHLLRDPVVRHVLVESKSTFTGMPKKEMFYAREALPDNIDVIQVDFHSVKGAWPREYAQRNAIVNGLVDARPSDVVMISDVDEIPTKDAIERFDRQKLMAATCLQKMWYYSWKWKLTDIWYGTVITTKLHLDTGVTPQQLRDERKKLPLLKRGGIHISYFGGIDEIKRKLISFAHEEYSHVAKQNQKIRRALSDGNDLFGRAEIKIKPSRRPNHLGQDVKRLNLSAVSERDAEFSR